MDHFPHIDVIGREKMQQTKLEFESGTPQVLYQLSDLWPPEIESG
jgi:hypothetical protein